MKLRFPKDAGHGALGQVINFNFDLQGLGKQTFLYSDYPCGMCGQLVPLFVILP